MRVGMVVPAGRAAGWETVALRPSARARRRSVPEAEACPPRRSGPDVAPKETPCSTGGGNSIEFGLLLASNWTPARWLGIFAMLCPRTQHPSVGQKTQGRASLPKTGAPFFCSKNS